MSSSSLEKRSEAEDGVCVEDAAPARFRLTKCVKTLDEMMCNVRYEAHCKKSNPISHVTLTLTFVSLHSVAGQQLCDAAGDEQFHVCALAGCAAACAHCQEAARRTEQRVHAIAL